MKRHFYLLLALVFAALNAFPQFPPAAGLPGSTAIHKDSSCFTYFGNACVLHPGYLDISQPGLGRVEAVNTQAATGRPDGLCISLGDSGWAEISLNTPLFNGPGFDFAVFENSFSEHFLELAFVEASSDGIHFLRFPSVSLTDVAQQQGPFDDNMEAAKIMGLAGKYKAFYGTPFDLSDLPDTAVLNKDSIAYLRIVDAVGSIQPDFASYDSQGHPVNDPYPTPFPSGGFDLDGVGFVHARFTGISAVAKSKSLFFYPNCISTDNNSMYFHEEVQGKNLRIYSASGKLVQESQIDQHMQVVLPPGMYFLTTEEFGISHGGKLFIVK